VSSTSMPARRRAVRSAARESGLRPGASSSDRISSARASRRRGRMPRGGRGPSSSVSSRSCTSDRHGTPANVISAATSAPDDSAASSSSSRLRSSDAATAASCRASSRSARRCSAGASDANSVGALGTTGARTSHSPDCSPSRWLWSTAGARRSTRRHRRRSWHRSTRTPAASRPGYQRAVSSHTQRGRSASRLRTNSARSAAASSCRVPPSATSTRSPGRRDTVSRVMDVTVRSGPRRPTSPLASSCSSS
jgi:hypothetical protein